MMDIKQIRSMLLCLTSIFLMQGHALEFDADVAHDLFTGKMDELMFENRLLKTKLEDAVRKMEIQTDRIASLEKASIKIEKQAEKLASLEEAKNRMENQAGRITNLEEAINKMQNHADKIAISEDTVNNMQKLVERLTNLEEAVKKEQKQADRLASLEETVNKMQKQANRITNLEKILNNTEICAKEGMNIESGMQELNNRIAKLENSTLNNEKAIGNVTRLEKENIITENMVSFTLNDFSKEFNETYLYFKQEVKTFVNETEQKLETLRGKMDEESDQLNVAYGEIQQLKTRIVRVETRQGRKAAFLATYSPHQSNGIIRFQYVRLNKGSGYNSSTGVFTCPFPGIYAFAATISEGGNGDNFIYCFIMKNDFDYVYMISRQGKIDGKYATRGFGTATGAATLHLVNGDRVAVYCTNYTGTTLRSSSFSGFLVSADP